MDHILKPGDQCTILTEGRVVISGLGAYALEAMDRLPLAS
jgi:hypothetical protein